MDISNALAVSKNYVTMAFVQSSNVIKRYGNYYQMTFSENRAEAQPIEGFKEK
jgi:hypothetical protein